MDAVVSNGHVRLATTDRPGDGPPIVLMHGLGATRRSMSRVASLLARSRVITMDLRGHGKSTTGPWSFDEAVADLDAVVAHYGLDKPYVGGHSLGGMVALHYGLRGRPVAGVVNIDGWGPGVAGRFPGADPTRVSRFLERAGEGELAPMARLLTSRTRQSREGTTRAVLQQLHGVDIVEWHRDLGVRSLAINATAPPGRVMAFVVGRENAALQTPYRCGLRRDLATLAQEQPLVRVVEVPATHALIRTHPHAVADAIEAFA